MKRTLPALLGIFLLVIFGCDSKPRSGDLEKMKPSRPQTEIEDEAIQAWIKAKGVKAEKDASGIYVVVENAGNEEHPNVQSQIQINYSGTLLNGNKFDSSYDRGQPLDYPLSSLIQGWQIGIPKFGKGGKGILLIPSHLGYGPRGSGDNIPPNSPLVFEIEVIDFQNP